MPGDAPSRSRFVEVERKFDVDESTQSPSFTGVAAPCLPKLLWCAKFANRTARIFSLLVDGLSDAQLATPSLCSGWDVKTVAAHIACSVADGLPAHWKTALRRGSLARATDEFARRRAQLPSAEIAATLRERADYRLSPPVVGPVGPLTDILIHSGDIRIPLGLPFEPDAEQVACALDFLTGTWPLGLVRRGRLSGIKLTDSRTGRSWRKGAEIRGPAAALMMAVSGRTALFETLDGPGLQLLGQRLVSG